MTWNAHASVGLAQAIFYFPALIAIGNLVFRRHSESRSSWIALGIFSIVRIVGGSILIAFEQNRDSVGYIIAGLILQGNGVIPLILSTSGLIRLIKSKDFPESKGFGTTLIMFRVFFLAAAALLVAGSSLQGNYQDLHSVSLGSKLAKTGYLMLVFIIVWLLGYDIFLWNRRTQLSQDTSFKALVATTASFPFMVVRVTYSCLAVFSSNQNKGTWSPLFGSVAALVLMHSLMEYIIVIMYICVGYLMPPLNKTSAKSLPSKRTQLEDEETRV